MRWGSADPQDFSEEANSEPFAVERWLGLVRSRLPGGSGEQAGKED